MFRVKVCGVTQMQDALTAVEVGADAIGLNFYPQSPRVVSRETAGDIAEAIRGRALAVGVFVNAPLDAIRKTSAQVGLDAVQLHGDELIESVAQLKPGRVVLARRVGEAGVAAIQQELLRCSNAHELPDAMLLDAAAPGHYGGAGQTFDWSALVGHGKWLHGAPLILAGGLRPENVAQAIAEVRPHGVDVASGVESSPGEKDPDKTARFVQSALRAFAATA